MILIFEENIKNGWRYHHGWGIISQKEKESDRIEARNSLILTREYFVLNKEEFL